MGGMEIFNILIEYKKIKWRVIGEGVLCQPVVSMCTWVKACTRANTHTSKLSLKIRVSNVTCFMDLCVPYWALWPFSVYIFNGTCASFE